MFVKRGDAKIIDVIKDSDHKIDDDGTRKVLDKAAKEVKEGKVVASKSLEN